MKKILIRGGTVVFADHTEICDILTDGTRIEKIGKKIAATDAAVIDAEGLFIFPGLIDMHVHLREPGYEYK